MKKRYTNSEKLLKQALQVIPLGTQTFSKSKTQYPFGASPYFVTRGKGSRVWDVDGNEYIDFINSLAAVTLGYNHPSVNQAVQNQMKKGVIFSLPHPLEVEVSKLITKLVPCAEMVRFGKNGSDVTAGAIRLARAYTKREHVAVCGYHGWQDWYIGSTARHLGVPECVRNLTHTFNYNKIESLEDLFKKFPKRIAAVILEPMNRDYPQPGFLESVKKLTHKHGALLVFDEVITGFRFSNGGAQEYFKVTPDLAVFGKGLANGYPVSALAGSKKIMQLLEEVFFSFTFGGETLSLAAALATMTELEKAPVIKQMTQRGIKLQSGIRKLIELHQLQNVLSVSGHPTWTFLNFLESTEYDLWTLKTYFLQEVFARGILTLGTHNLSAAHSEKDIQTLLRVYDEVFGLMKRGIQKKNILQMLHCKPLKPLFKVR